MAVRVVTDSTSYLSRAERAEFDIGVARLSSTLEGVTYDDDAEDYAAFYGALAATDAFPTTSQPPVQEMADLFEERVAAGDSVVGVFISAKMSGTNATAHMAREMVLESYPDATIEVIDSRSNCMELGFAALAAARRAAEGGSVVDVVAAADATIDRTRFLFVPDTLEYLRRGGRIGNASALLGTLLQIRPILTVVDGQTDVFGKVRTKKRALAEIAAAFAADIATKGGLTDAIVHHINDEPEGREIASLIAEAAGRDVPLRPIGPAIGAHVGPGTVGVVYATANPMRKQVG